MTLPSMVSMLSSNGLFIAHLKCLNGFIVLDTNKSWILWNLLFLKTVNVY